MDENKAAELAEAIRSIRERVAARYPSQHSGHSTLPLVDLMPLARARDTAEVKVAAIGTLNPRPPGPVNSIIQAVKGALARSLNWLLRPQVEFNRHTLVVAQATIDALNDFNRLALELDRRIQALPPRIEACERHAGEQADIESHWIEWRRGWEDKVAINEIQYLRGVADLQAAFQQRVAQMEQQYRDQLRSQHSDYEGALNRYSIDIQKRMWEDLRQTRLEFERLIHQELKLIRQRTTPLPGAPVAAAAAVETPAQYDTFTFAHRFRGDEESVRKRFAGYVDRFRDCRMVLDAGCGRGEFLALLEEAGIPAAGVDSEPDTRFIRADLFEYLAQTAGDQIDGIFCGQVVEHIPPLRLPELIHLFGRKLAPGGTIVIETPNPECLAIFATHFYLDPTHQRPVPAQLLSFYLEEAGFGEIRVDYHEPAEDHFGELKELPAEVRKRFFGGLDYSITARRL